VKIDCPEAGRAFRPGSPGTDVPVDGRQLPRARRPSVSSRERPIRYARWTIWASSRLMVARLGAAPLAVALEYPNHGVTHAGSTTGINDRSINAGADRGNQPSSDGHIARPREWRGSAFTIPLPRGSRLRWRVAIPSDRGRSPPHPPAPATRQDGAQLVLLARSREGHQDDGPDDCTTDAVGRIAVQSISHPRIIPAHRVM
jgi:hypothetical protein